MQGGNYSDPSGPMMQPDGPQGGGSVKGMEESRLWKFLFFAAACVCVATSVLSVLSLMYNLEFAPFDAVNQLYLALFGFVMIILDSPVPNESFKRWRLHVFKFVRFMTRFVGRGAWYVFLGTLVFASLWDNNINPFLGIVLGGYVIGLGAVALTFGIRLSVKLESARKKILSDPQQYQPRTQTISKEELQSLLARAEPKATFTGHELDYVVNGLASKCEHGDVVHHKDFQDWLGPGYLALL